MIILISLIILLISILIFLFFLYVAYRMSSPPRFVGKWNPENAGLNYEDVEIKSEDGTVLRGWWIDRGARRTIIILHGYTSSRWGFYIIPMITFLAKNNYNILTFDFRAHGESGGKYTTVGDKELGDFLSFLHWLTEKKKDGKIGVLGYSMGAIVTLRALAMEDGIDAGIADSPPINIDMVGKRGLKYFAKLPEWIYVPVKPLVKLITGAKELNMEEYAEKIKKPLLLIAGENDPLVKVDEVMGFYKRNKKINKNVEIWVTKGAHVRSIKVDEEFYKKKILEFFERCLYV